MGRERVLALSGLEYFKELSGLRFRDLTPTIQRGLLRRSITAIVLLAETTRPSATVNDVRMILFRRLNTGGARLNAQEMRNALYPGEFKDMLARVARDDKFCEIWRIPKKTPDENEQKPPDLTRNALYRNMADCELVLRFFAIKETIESNLKGSIRHILDKCMERHCNDKPSVVAKAEEQYLHCLHTLYTIFGGKAFVLPTTERPSRPLYDALMVALSRQTSINPEARAHWIRQSLVAALTDQKKYDILIGRGNTVDSIKDRVLLAEQILNG